MQGDDSISVRHARPADRDAWVHLRQALWPDSAVAHASEVDRFFRGVSSNPLAVVVGVGRALVDVSEDWARSQGCTEFASDSEADNELGALAHRALGFADAGLVRCFRKDL